MNKQDIVCIKTSGEKVYLIALTDRNTWQVRRPNVTEAGAIEHSVDEFFAGELEPVEAYYTRLVDEMIMKAKVQKKLLKAELSITEELEAEAERAAQVPKSIN